MLFYFPGNRKKEAIECISLDSAARKDARFCLKRHGIASKNIYRPTKARQADSYSCHTDALVVLRNALLSLRYHRFTNGFKEALQAGSLVGNKIISFPPEWDYTSQIKNTSLGSQSAIRTFFSKKQKVPQTAKSHRKKHTQTQRFKYTIHLPKSIAALPPKGVLYKQEGSHMQSVSFIYAKKVNTYIFNKGYSMAKRAVEGTNAALQ